MRTLEHVIRKVLGEIKAKNVDWGSAEVMLRCSLNRRGAFGV